MLHGRNIRFFFLWERNVLLMKNIFIVPATQHMAAVKKILLPVLVISRVVCVKWSKPSEFKLLPVSKALSD